VDGYIASAQSGGDLVKLAADDDRHPVRVNVVGLPPPEEALNRHFNEVQKRTGLSLYGRNMYEVMKCWDDPPAESSELEQEYAHAWQGTPKVVFSTTLDRVGPNARLVKEKADTERTVRQLKAETSGEIGVNGAGLAASLVRFGLVDEFRLYVMPVVLGGGTPYFEAGLQLELEPLGTESLPQHCTLLRFRPKKSRA
jgi:dihydrofolate reductase